MISTKYLKKPFTRSTLFCDRPFDIENYDRARLDDAPWVCHHRLECNNGVQQYTSEQLKQLGLYYHQPAESLIFLPYWFHHKMHDICRDGNRNEFISHFCEDNRYIYVPPNELWEQIAQSDWKPIDYDDFGITLPQ